MWLTCHVAEYMMFNDDEKDTKIPLEISSSDSVIDFLDLEESKNKIQSDKQDVTLGSWNKNAFRFIPNSFNE